MSKQYPGGLITKTPVTPTGPYQDGSAPGIWTLNQAAYWKKQGLWPTAGYIPTDPYFNYVTMLLHGNGSASGTTNVLPFNSDASTNAFNVTINGDARSNNFNPYQAGYYSNSFDGSGDYLSVADANALDFAGDFTVEAWVFVPTTSGSARTIIHKADTNVGYALVLISAGNVEIQCTSLQFNSTSTLPLNQWNHVAMVRNGSGTNNVKFYLNGVLDGQGTNTTDTASSVTLGIGAVARSGAAGVNPLNGYISNVRTVSSAVYTSNFTPSTTPLTAISGTSLLTCQSNRFIDNSTNAFTITRNGDTTVAPAQPFTLPSSVATYGSGYFDGSGDFLSFTTNSTLEFGTGDFTIEFWINGPLNNDNGIFDPRSSMSGNMHITTGGYGGTTAGSLRFVCSAGTFTSGSTLITNGQWNHCAVVRSSGTLNIYINGVSTTSASVGTSFTGTGSAWIATLSGGTANYLNAYLSNFRIVKAAVYTSNFTPSTTPLTAIANTSLLTTQYNGAGNNNGFIDSSQNNFPITRNGNTTQGTFTPYGANWSNYFDGSGDYLSTPGGTAFDFGSGNFTVEAWLYRTTTGGFTVISDSQYWYAFSLRVNSSGAVFSYGFSSSTSSQIWYCTSANNLVPSNAWCHLALVRNGSSIVVYLNGSNVASTTVSGSAGTTSSIRIAHNDSGVEGAGYVSNARIVKGTAVYTSTFTPPTAPLTAISGTSLLTCADNRFIDDSTNNFPITRNGDVSVQRFSPFAPTSAYSTSTIGGSGYFDGSGDYLRAPTGYLPSIGTGSFTVEGWWNFGDFTTRTTYFQRLWSFGTGLANDVTLNVDNSGNLVFRINDSIIASQSSGAMKLNSWNHVALVRSGSTVTIYLNGTSVASASNSSNLTTQSTSPFYIGSESDGAGGYFYGYCSDVRISNTAVYTSAFTPNTTPLTATIYTSLLLNMTNAAIYDNAMMNDLETVGNAMVSTSVKKFGNASMYFDGTVDRLTSASNPRFAFGTGDFTIEGWFYINSGSGTNNGALQISGTAGGLQANQTNNLAIFSADSSGNKWGVYYANTFSYGSASTTQTWVYLALVRSSGSLKLYINGTADATFGTKTDTTNYTGQNVVVGGYYSTSYLWNGYVDDLRITNGVARYTTNFTAPTSQFLDQ